MCLMYLAKRGTMASEDQESEAPSIDEVELRRAPPLPAALLPSNTHIKRDVERRRSARSRNIHGALPYIRFAPILALVGVGLNRIGKETSTLRAIPLGRLKSLDKSLTMNVILFSFNAYTSNVQRTFRFSNV